MGIVLLLPFFLIRFGLLALLNRQAVGRAAHFAPVQGRERWAYILYQLANVWVFLSICLLRVDLADTWVFYTGIAVYALGLALLIGAMVSFAAPNGQGLNQSGLYRFSRNPMYVAYYVFFIGCILLTRSPILLLGTVLFAVSNHWIILAEERWCLDCFGQDYGQYMVKVRRYI